MQVGIIGLGRMGANLARHATESGHQVVGYDPDAATRAEIQQDGVTAVACLADMAFALTRPRIVLIYVPHGDPTESVCRDLLALLAGNDIVADGGNSKWTDSIRR